MYFLLFENLKNFELELDIENKTMKIGKYSYDRRNIFFMNEKGVVFQSIRGTVPKFAILDGIWEKSNVKFDNFDLPGKNLEKINQERAKKLLGDVETEITNTESIEIKTFILKMVEYENKDLVKDIARGNDTQIEWEPDTKQWIWIGVALPECLKPFQNINSAIKYFFIDSDKKVAKEAQKIINLPTYKGSGYVKRISLRLEGKEIYGFDFYDGPACEFTDGCLLAYRILHEENLDFLKGQIEEINEVIVKRIHLKTGESTSTPILEALNKSGIQHQALVAMNDATTEAETELQQWLQQGKFTYAIQWLGRSSDGEYKIIESLEGDKIEQRVLELLGENCNDKQYNNIRIIISNEKLGDIGDVTNDGKLLFSAINGRTLREIALAQPEEAGSNEPANSEANELAEAKAEIARLKQENLTLTTKVEESGAQILELENQLQKEANSASDSDLSSDKEKLTPDRENEIKHLQLIIAVLKQNATDIKTKVGNPFKSERSAKAVRTRMKNKGLISEQESQQLTPTQVDGGWVLRKNKNENENS